MGTCISQSPIAVGKMRSKLKFRFPRLKLDFGNLIGTKSKGEDDKMLLPNEHIVSAESHVSDTECPNNTQSKHDELKRVNIKRCEETEGVEDIQSKAHEEKGIARNIGLDFDNTFFNHSTELENMKIAPKSQSSPIQNKVMFKSNEDQLVHGKVDTTGELLESLTMFEDKIDTGAESQGDSLEILSCVKESVLIHPDSWDSSGQSKFDKMVLQTVVPKDSVESDTIKESKPSKSSDNNMVSEQGKVGDNVEPQTLPDTPSPGHVKNIKQCLNLEAKPEKLSTFTRATGKEQVFVPRLDGDSAKGLKIKKIVKLDGDEDGDMKTEGNNLNHHFEYERQDVLIGKPCLNISPIEKKYPQKSNTGICSKKLSDSSSISNQLPRTNNATVLSVQCLDPRTVAHRLKTLPNKASTNFPDTDHASVSTGPRFTGRLKTPNKNSRSDENSAELEVCNLKHSLIAGTCNDLSRATRQIHPRCRHLGSKVTCPDQKCLEKVRCNQLLNHINIEHPQSQWLGELEPDRFYKQCWSINSKENFGAENISWVLTLWCFDGNVFLTMFEKIMSKWYSWIYVLDDDATALNYVYKVWLPLPRSKKDIIYNGRVHSINTEKNQICNNGDCLVLDDNLIYEAMTNEGVSNLRKTHGFDYRLPMHYCITASYQVR